MTNHAHDQMKNRLGLNKSARNRIATKALNEGLSMCDLTGGQREYLYEKYMRVDKETDYDDRQIKLYNDHVYVFDGNRMITVFKLPKHLIE